MPEFSEQRVLVTGGSAGIGLEISAELLRRGARVTILARTRNRLLEAQRCLAEYGSAEIVVCDTMDPEGVSSAVELSWTRMEGLNGVVNCAGVGPQLRSFAELTDEDFAHRFDVNVMGTVRVIRAALPQLLLHRSSSIVNVASMAGKTGVPMWSDYCTSKHALIGLTKCIAKEYAAQGLRCNAICPGFVNGGLMSGDFLGRWADALGIPKKSLVSGYIKRRTPTGRFVSLSSVSTLAAHLLGPGAEDMTGQALSVCGGIGDA